MLGLYTLEVLAQIMMKERSILQTDFLTSVLFLLIHETDGNVKILHPRTPLSSLCFKITYTSYYSLCTLRLASFRKPNHYAVFLVINEMMIVNSQIRYTNIKDFHFLYLIDIIFI
jgi:hypothetical protein